MVDLPKHSGNPSAIMRSTTGQIRGDDLTGTGINREVQLPPSPVLRWFPEMTDVDPEPRTIDEMSKWIGRSVASLRNWMSPSFLSRRDNVV